jgi:AbrB family looped-hinge helix DNA binding protein
MFAYLESQGPGKSLTLKVGHHSLCKAKTNTKTICYNVRHMETLFTMASSKGQIVIPAALRQKLGIKAGTRLAVTREEGRLILQPVTEDFIDSVMGSCKGEDSLVEVLQRERRIEK